MPSELEKKLTKAEKLRTKSAFPFCYFVAPDYNESAELFCEIARDSSTIEDQCKYYLEAANTFLMQKDEYNEFCASECYRKLYEVLEKKELERALGYYQRYAEILEKMKKYLTAGQAYAKIGDAWAKSNPDKAIEFYSKAILTYKKDRASCTFHLKSCLQGYLLVLLELEKLEEAINILDQLDTKYSKLCKQILTIVLGRSDFHDDVLNLDENRLVMALLNKSREDSIKDLEAFRSDNYLPDAVSKIFDISIRRMSPENDIC